MPAARRSSQAPGAHITVFTDRPASVLLPSIPHHRGHPRDISDGPIGSINTPQFYTDSSRSVGFADSVIAVAVASIGRNPQQRHLHIPPGTRGAQRAVCTMPMRTIGKKPLRCGLSDTRIKEAHHPAMPSLIVHPSDGEVMLLTDKKVSSYIRCNPLIDVSRRQPRSGNVSS